MSRHLLRQALRLPQAAIKRLVTGLLQLVLLANRPARLARAGFVLPTTVLLVLMVVLTATALTYRSFTRSDMAISQREQQVIANAATPALDRARAKIEFLFNKDTRYTSGLPTGDFLASMMLATPYDTGLVALPNDPFTLPGETRLDINRDNKLDNAWSFVSDANGETIAYSIVVDDQATPTDSLATTGANIQGVTSPLSQAKANALVTRTGPLATTEATSICSNARAEKGWQVVNNGATSALQKNFQINVFVPNANNANRTVEAFEFQQSRIANRGNKWAAWFRYDMEIYPGAPFTINGAMHTDSSLMAGGGSTLTSYMISSHNSCVYGKEASEITVGAQSTDGTFQGQIVNGVVFNDTYGGTSPTFHIWDGNNRVPTTNRQLTDSNDSVSGGSPGAVAVNPLVLFTEDRLAHTASTWTRDNAWDNNPILTGERIFNKRVAKPFVDDFSRADNRWGPKPRYSDTDPNLAVSATRLAGSKITTNTDLLADPAKGLDGYWERQALRYGLRLIVGERLHLGNPVEWNRNPATNTIAQDRLYPPNAAPAVGTQIKANEYRQKRALRDNLAAVQSMAVYHYQTENGEFPAACMAMTAHPGTTQSIVNSRTFALINGSTTTTDVKTDFLNGVGTNGWEYQWPATWSNGSGGSITYAAAIAPSLPLGKALRNLAYFAGDPVGGAPSFTAVQDSVVHPYPYMSMWGDFSVLRRVLSELDAGGYASAEYDPLSPADKATLHTATCTVGMLARNVQQVRDEFDNASDNLTAGYFTSNGQKVVRLVDYKKTGGNGEVTDIFYTPDINGAPNPFYDLNRGANMAQVYSRWAGGYNANGDGDFTDPGEFPPQDTPSVIINLAATDTNNNGVVDPTEPLVYSCAPGVDIVGTFQEVCDMGEFAASLSFEQWKAALRIEMGADAEPLIRAMTIISTGFSSERDRAMGFSGGYYPSTLFAGTGTIKYDPSSGYSSVTNVGGEQVSFKSACNPDTLLGALGGGAKGASSRDAIVLSVAICGKQLPIKYPSLYYLFPLLNHDHDGGAATTAINGYNDTQPTAEQYITDPNNYIASSAVNGSVTYQAINPTTPNDLNSIALVPAGLDLSTGWKLPPTPAASTLTAPNDTAQAFTINVAAAGRNVAFLDKGIFNGREQLAVRVLDIDLNRLTNSTNGGTNRWWIPDVACDANTQDCDVFTEGIVYAFREDAVREDEIVRPAATANSSSCLTVADITSTTCRMVTTPGAEKDPPLTPSRISLKPVDFVADPDRRPHGFRLRNGDDMSRSYQRGVGMTLVTDNSVYVQGDFNRHFGKTKTTNAAGVSTEAGTAGPMEEFTATVGNQDWSVGNFYNARTQLNLNRNFAQPLTDRWRPVEILADSFTILSNGFIDGAVEDTFTRDRPGAPAATNTSYMNQSRPNTAQNVVREGGTTAPVFIDRNGNAFVGTNPINSTTVLAHNDTAWSPLGTSEDNRRRNTRAVDSDISVNALFIAGIVPSRPDQGYGGLHNFPRLVENWDGRSINIAGSFFQLNFATASTGPFEHDAWEPEASPVAGTGNTGEKLGYYRPPTRRWGYDPAMLYYPPAAAARRFVSVDTPRSEYFRELPADDPYIANLRCANRTGNAPVYDANIRGICPA